MIMRKAFSFLLAMMLMSVTLFSGCDNGKQAGLDAGSDGQSLSDGDDLLQGGLGAPGKMTKDYSGFIGCGYDVINSPYYQSDEVKACALDTDKMVEDGLIYEDVNAQRTTEFSTEAGQDIYSYMSNLAVTAGVETSSLFGGSLKVDFGLDTSSKVNEQKSFAKGSAILTKVKQNVLMGKITDREFREKYLLKGFKEALLDNSITPAELFDIYGTHIMLSVSLGGRLDMSYVYDNIKHESAKEIKTSVEASWGAVSAKTSTNFSENTSHFFENSTLKVKSYGGKVDIDMSGFDSAKANYKEWSTSIESTEYLTLIKAGNLKSKSEMYPVWLLIDTSVPSNASQKEKDAAAERKIRQDAIEDEYKTLLEKAGSNLEKYQDKVTYIKDIYFGSHSGASQAKSDLFSKSSDEIYIIELDLNMNTRKRGDYTYLGYTTTTEPDEAIRDLVFHFHRDPPETIKLIKSKDIYTKDDTGVPYTLRSQYDLNKGAGGDDIFLFYSKDKEAGDPIRTLSVEIIGVTKSTERIGSGWTRVKDWNEPHKYDLNKNAGGKDIYLWFQR